MMLVLCVPEFLVFFLHLLTVLLFSELVLIFW